MSRAFVKDPDHDLPEPERPVSPHPNYITPDGLERLRRRLAEARRLDARGDAGAGREARWLTARIALAIPVQPEDPAPDRVAFGARVTVIDEDGRQHRYRIVGEDEAQPEQGAVSWMSPLGRALVGAERGETVTWERPAGNRQLEIVDIGYERTH